MISPQATAAAQKYLRGVPPDRMMGALGGAISENPTVSLVELIMAHKLLTQQQQEQEAERAKQMAMAGAGLPGLMPQQTTVAQQVTDALAASNENLEQEIMASAAQPAREGGIANLNAGGLGRDYANGGIVAFENGGSVEARGVALDEAKAALAATKNPPGLNERNQARIEGKPDPLIAYQTMQQQLVQNRNNAQAAYEKAISPPTGAGMGFKPLPILSTPAAPAAAQPAVANANDPYRQSQPYDIGQSAVKETVDKPAAAPPADLAGPAGPAGPASSADPAGSAATITRPAETITSSPGFSDLMAKLGKDADTARGMISANMLTPAPAKTVEEQARADALGRDTFLKAQGMQTSAESLRTRTARLASEGAQARQDRDVDRWLAAAQGFFAMSAGQSQHAMQNIAAGLGITTKELRAVEVDYRKGVKLRSDRADLIQEAARLEAVGDYAKADKAVKDAEKLAVEIRSKNATLGTSLLNSVDNAMGRLQSAESATQGRKQTAADARATREATAAEGLAFRRDAAAATAQSRADAAQNRADTIAREENNDYRQRLTAVVRIAEDKNIKLLNSILGKTYQELMAGTGKDNLKALDRFAATKAGGDFIKTLEQNNATTARYIDALNKHLGVPGVPVAGPQVIDYTSAGIRAR